MKMIIVFLALNIIIINCNSVAAETLSQLISECSRIVARTESAKTIKACTEVIELEPDNYVAYHNRAYAFFDSGDIPAGKSDLEKEKLIRFSASNSSSKDRVLCYRPGALGAIEACTRLIIMNPNDGGLYNARGVAKSFDHETAKASVSDFERAISLGNVSAKTNLDRIKNYLEDYP